MIVTVTLNAALDTTYRVGDVDWDGVNRVHQVHRRAGGKGVNVARVLSSLGHDILATGLAGGPTGQAILADLDAAGLPHAFTPIAGESRATLVISSVVGGDAGTAGGDTAGPPRAGTADVGETVPGGAGEMGDGTAEPRGGFQGGGGEFRGGGGAGRTALFNEPGPEVTDEELGNFLTSWEARVKAADAVVMSGSLPRGVPVDFYATLARVAAGYGVPVIVDADGAPLRHAPAGRPAILKPNHEELARAVPGGAPVEAAQVLRSRGAGSVVVSMGKDGLLAVTPDGDFRARMPYTVDGNPTGAGDALVAGLALGLVEATPWPERLRRAAALGAAAVAAPVAGDFDHAVYADIHHKITIT
ncbi:1-phosphofructokinase family hexose kinase [Nonomuraea typhae]|uniref:1-phosphofructokinase family hexose kinase n=1 Tax=Nonomuraea typhae TaxID=2603600 RepID=UPI0012F868AD|nr:1-phosphofructokinase family hexose kinase [Nonomuraea typhae]